jgi:hypothetical protein
MINRFIRIVLLTIVSAALATGAFADPIPEGARGENIEAVGYIDAPNASPFKMSLLQSGDRWYMYTSNRTNDGQFHPGSSEHINLAAGYRRQSYDYLIRRFAN